MVALRRPWAVPMLVVGVLQLCLGSQNSQVCKPNVTGTIYEYSAMTLNGSRYVPFSEYMGKTVLFVNVATY